ncbi:hypothetical protein M3D48_02125 [Dermabacter vaginalis]|uniref:hypothetical protein n=1 Tax=Dermabacter vaginalis TaxID=1630135 RepID=UPI001EF62EF6|nr:hypothetical protein [Dermabacter vaginalis]MCG7443856.1 hypothetical protein [Dermabacter vaginalis]MCT2149430.1 hypothetical protein [Dermabacter vaginalis]
MSEQITARVRGTDVALGPTFAARLVPWLRWGAPLLSAVFLPVTGLYVHRQLWWPWWTALPAAWVAGWVLLALLMLAVLLLTHRTTWWNPVTGLVQRGRKRLEAARVRAVVPDFRPQGVTVLESGEGGRRLLIPYSGWDDRSYEGIAEFERQVCAAVSPSRPELLARDRTARKSWQNRALAKRYAMTWREEFEDPHVFLEAFDARRKELARRRR